MEIMVVLSFSSPKFRSLEFGGGRVGAEGELNKTAAGQTCGGKIKRWSSKTHCFRQQARFKEVRVEIKPRTPMYRIE